MLLSVVAITFFAVITIRNTITTSRRVGHRIHSGISVNFNTVLYAPIFVFVCVLLFVYLCIQSLLFVVLMLALRFVSIAIWTTILLRVQIDVLIPSYYFEYWCWCR